MALLSSGLSVAAITLRSVLGQNIAGLDENQISIGSPKQAEDSFSGGHQQLNIFIYNAEFAPYTGDLLPQDSPTVKVFCLLTPFGVADAENNISAGENELRLIGEAIRVLHENPEINLRRKDNSEFAEVQIMMHNISMDDMNKIWSAQGEAAYRISVGCELSLIPVIIDPQGRTDFPPVSEIVVENYSKSVHETDPEAVVSIREPEVVIVRDESDNN